jgi:hypothetical protein
MATSANDFGKDGFAIGWVFSHTFGTIRSNPLPTLGIAFLFGALPITLVGYGQAIWTEAATRTGGGATFAIGLFAFLLYVLLSLVTQGALVRATVAHSEGRKASFAESAMAGLRVAVPLVLLGILSTIGFAFGFLFLVVPGIILFVMWSVAGPALVEERLGPVEALRRSYHLTAGSRWKIFGLMLVAFVIYLIIWGLVALLAFVMLGELSEISDQASMPTTLLIVNTLSQTVISALWGVLLSSVYVQLRRLKDGPSAAALADVFA